MPKNTMTTRSKKPETRIPGLPHPIYGDGIVSEASVTDDSHKLPAGMKLSAVESIARKCAIDMDIDWKVLPDRARDAFVALAVSAIAGSKPEDPHVVDTFGKGVMASGPEFKRAAQFQKAVRKSLK